MDQLSGPFGAGRKPKRKPRLKTFLFLPTLVGIKNYPDNASNLWPDSWLLFLFGPTLTRRRSSQHVTPIPLLLPWTLGFHFSWPVSFSCSSESLLSRFALGLGLGLGLGFLLACFSPVRVRVHVRLGRLVRRLEIMWKHVAASQAVSQASHSLIHSFS